MSETTSEISKVLFSAEEIQCRVRSMAEEIAEFYAGKPLTVVAILHGSLIFAADLIRHLPIPLWLETLQVSSYHGGTESSGTISFRQKQLPSVEGRHVLLLDDIFDTGLTMKTIADVMEREGAALSVRSAVLLTKRRPRAISYEVDYAGFEIGDEFVIGYGLDYQGVYRNLPYIGVFNPDAAATPS